MPIEFKTILVHVDTDRRAAIRVEQAMRLARQFGSHVIGLHGGAQAQARAAAPAQAETAHQPSARDRAATGAVADLAASFERAGAEMGASDIEWRESSLDPTEAFAVNARYADLIVLSQHDPHEAHNTVGAHFAETVALQAGRPVMVIPHAGTFSTVGTRILVGWNASREAARAVSDALPFLKQAQEVTVLEVNSKRGARAADETSGAASCAVNLARHGVKVKETSDPSVAIDVGNYLLSRAADIAADLIVMGAYGHARLREMLLGGVTRTVIQHMTVPVLFSH